MHTRSTRRTAYIETEVDVDLDDFDFDDVVEYVEERGYTVLEGKEINCGIENLDERIWKLYQAWKLDGDERMSFWYECHSFFSDYYNKVSA